MTDVCECSVSTINDNAHIVNVRYESSQTEKPKEIEYLIVVDNSQSMGYLTKDAISIICGGVLDYTANAGLDVKPSTVIAFSEMSYFLSTSVKQRSDINVLIESLPCQRNTNITGAVEDSVSHLERSNPNHHFVMIFLSDGHHNQGNPPTKSSLEAQRVRLERKGIKLSVIIVGVSVNSSTNLGMMIKTELESVPIQGVQPIYYAQNTSDMRTVLQSMTTAITEQCSGKVLNLKLPQGFSFIDGVTTATWTQTNNSEVSFFVTGSGNLTTVNVNDSIIQTTQQQITMSKLTNASETMISKLAQVKVAGTDLTIDNKISLLEGLIVSVGETLALAMQQSNQIDFSSSAARKKTFASHIKKIALTQDNTLRQRLNELKTLRIGERNDSSHTATYLSGMNRKYAAKAVIRSGDMDVSMKDVISSLKTTIDLLENLEEDQSDTSFLSVNTVVGHLSEWKTMTNVDNKDTDTGIYELLTQFGMVGYPVIFDNNNACQMDPYQTRCIDIFIAKVDTASVALANQVGYTVKIPGSGEQFKDVILYIDSQKPEYVKQTTTAIKSIIAERYNSTVLCRDLYMTHPLQQIAMSSHAFVRAVEKYFITGITAYSKIAMDMLFTIRTLRPNINFDLLSRWMNDCDSITTSQEDNCKHPIQLIIALACSEKYEEISTSSPNTPLFNLLNEILHRSTTKRIISFNKTVREVFKSMYGITADNSPKANQEDLLTPEPPFEEVIRKGCPSTYSLKNFDSRMFGSGNFKEYILKCIMPYYYAFHYALYLFNTCHWIDPVGRDVEIQVPSFDISVSVLETMFVHSSLKHNVVDSVTDESLLPEILNDLHADYYRESLVAKQVKFIQNHNLNSEQIATYGLLEVFEGLMSNHIHVHTGGKDWFWAVVHAINADQDEERKKRKKESFTEHSCKNSNWFRRNKGKKP